MKKSSPSFRYSQRASDHLPKLALRVDVIPLADGNRPVGISVKDGSQVIGTLSMEVIAAAMAEYERGLIL